MKTTTTQNLLVAVMAVGILSGCGKKGTDAWPASNATSPSVSANATNVSFAKLPGKWLRPDGGYVIEIRNVEPGGKLDAGYFNPQPINVAKAEASQDGGIVTVFLELRDVNYPGSTYKLIYDRADDQLKGKYYQAVARETYTVFFERLKP